MIEPSVGAIYRLPSFFSACKDEGQVLTYSKVPIWESVSTAWLLEIATIAGYIKNVDGTLYMTEAGLGVSGLSEGPFLIRRYLSDAINLRAEAWTSLVYRGQVGIKTCRFTNLRQCFEEAGLLGQDAETVAWWDSRAALKRTADEQLRILTGRAAEMKSIEYEERRTGERPKWSSLENLYSPYDLISRVSCDDSLPLLIEVKGSSRVMDDAVMHLSRNEWNVLSTAKHSCFHVWVADSDQDSPYTLSTSDVLAHVPHDRAAGEWWEVRIPFAELISAEGSTVETSI